MNYALTDFQELPDGSLFGVGGVYIFDEEGRIDDFDSSWAVRLDSNGCIIPDCSGYEIFTTGKKEEYKIDDGLYSIAPNPAIDYFRVISQGNPFDELRIRIRSMGRSFCRKCTTIRKFTSATFLPVFISLRF